jgi:hypothetical protein
MPEIQKRDAPKPAQDSWPRYHAGPEDHLHALGVISVNYNMIESLIATLLQYYAGSESSDFFFDRINNHERLEAIDHFASLKERDPKVLSIVRYLLSYFSICTGNRNILMHSKHSIGDHSAEILPLEKKASRDPSRLLYFRLLLPELQKCADEIRDGVEFLEAIVRYLHARDDLLDSERARLELPKEPPKPKVLNPSPLGDRVIDRLPLT